MKEAEISVGGSIVAVADTGNYYGPDEQPELLLGRGYTGHEHLPWFGLINMNARLYDPAVHRFLSPDPEVQLPDNTQNYNRYTYCLNNPLRYIDPDGENTYIFDSYGKLERIKYDINTNRIMIHTKLTSNGLTWDKYTIYQLADPINDGKAIEDGTITQLMFVTDSEIRYMLETQGAWIASKSDFIKESTAAHKFDYSYSIMQMVYDDAHFNKINSDYLFIPEGDFVAHNYMNFGNYLWGATGYVVGFKLLHLRLGAHMNSLINGARDGWSHQFDSGDDQYSITQGYNHAKRYNY